MTDTVTAKIRSRIMASVPQKNTSPEIVVRKCLHSLGFRYRLHAEYLPGRPDIVLPKYSTVIFVHGCFWHQHARCKKSRPPSSNKEFWKEKFRKNKSRDRRQSKALRKLGWEIVTIWECETINTVDLAEKILNSIQ